MSKTPAELRSEFRAVADAGGPLALEGAGWEFCQGDPDHARCPGGWEMWGLTDRARHSIYHAGEAVLLAGPFDENDREVIPLVTSVARCRPRLRAGLS